MSVSDKQFAELRSIVEAQAGELAELRRDLAYCPHVDDRRTRQRHELRGIEERKRINALPPPPPPPPYSRITLVRISRPDIYVGAVKLFPLANGHELELHYDRQFGGSWIDVPTAKVAGQFKLDAAFVELLAAGDLTIRDCTIDECLAAEAVTAKHTASNLLAAVQ